MRRILIALVCLLLVAPGAAWIIRNPERETLDAEARAAAPGRFVTLTAGATHYEVAGPDTGRVAVLVHGFSVPAYIWDSTFHALAAAGHRVIRYDLYGRGLSDRPDAAYDGAMYDAQLGELLDSLGVTQPVDLMGLSFGGFVIAHFAAAHPERVRTLVFVDPVTQGRTLPGVVTTPFIGPWFWQVMVVPPMAEGQASDFLHPERHPDWADRYRPQMRYRGFGRALRRSAMAQRSVDFASLYARIHANGTPVLLLWGKQDPTTPIDGAERITRAIPATQFVPIDSAGHLPHLEQTATFNARLFEFLAAHPPTAR